MAIKSFNILIRLHKRRIDVMRRELRALEEQHSQLLALAAALTQEFEHEIGLAGTDAKLSGFFGAYAQRVRQQQDALAQEAARIAAAIAEKTEAIRSEYAEQKKYEIARTHALHRLAEKEKQRQQAIFDDIGTRQYLNQQEQPV